MSDRNKDESASSSSSTAVHANVASRTFSPPDASSDRAVRSKEHLKWPPVRRPRSAFSSSLSVDTAQPLTTSRHRHTQSTSSTHAPIPSPVYLARSQPIGLLSRSSSGSVRQPMLGFRQRAPTDPRGDEQGTTAQFPRRALLHRSESLPTFPPEAPHVDSGRSRKESVSVDELAALPTKSKNWRPSQLSLYLAATLSLPRPLRADITSFVVSSCLTGRTFLHLREVDLEEIGLNILWRKALLDACDRLRHEANGGRTYWGLEGPPLAELDPTAAPLTSLSRRLSDAGSVVSEDGEAIKEEWKNSWRYRQRRGSTGKVDSLRQTFERAASDDPYRGERIGDEASRSSRRISLRETGSHAWIATLWTSTEDRSHDSIAQKRLSPVLSAADMSATADETAGEESEPSSLSFSASPDSLSTWTPLPFLTGAGLKSRTTALAGGDPIFASSDDSRDSPATLRTSSAFDSWMRPNAALSSARVISAADEAGLVDEDELDTIRPVRSPEPHLPASLVSPVQQQDPSALAQLFDLELLRSPPSRPLNDANLDGHARRAGSADELIPMLVPLADEYRHERDPRGGEASVRRKKGSLVLVRKSQFVALQSRMREVEAQLSAVLAASPSLDEPVSVGDPDGTWQFKGEEICAEELLQLDAQMRRLEAASSLFGLDAEARSAAGRYEPPTTVPSSSAKVSMSATAVPSDAASNLPASLSRRRTRHRHATTASSSLDPSENATSYVDGADAVSRDAWDVGRSGWPHDRIQGWKQLSGYVVAASIGIGIVAGEIVASKLLGLRRR